MDLVDYVYFIVFSAVFALFLMYLMFLSSISFGFIVSKLVSTFVMPKDTFLRINSFHLSVMTGKIVFKGLKLATKNTCIRVVEGSITFRFWRKKIRQSVYLNDDSPCRIGIELSGLEFLVYNNSFKYDYIQDILEKKKNGMPFNINVNSNSSSNNTTSNVSKGNNTNNSNDNDSQCSNEDKKNDQVPPMVSVRDFVIPRFYRMFSATSFIIRKGCVMLSNPELPTMLVVLFDKGTGLYTIDSARSIDLDYYRQITTLDLVNTKINLTTNKDYNGEEELYVDRPQKEDFASYAFESFKSVFKDIKFTFIDTDENYETSDLPRRRGGEARQSRGENLVDYGKYTEILTSPQIHVNYYCDVAGPVPPGAEHATFKEFLAPQWGAELNLHTTTIVYGPWADRNRVLLQKFFLPTDYETHKLYKPVVGEPRQYAKFKLQMNFSKNSIFRIPFRELSKDLGLSADEIANKKSGWIDIRMEDNSSFICSTPLTVHKASGSDMEISVVLNRVTIKTSLTNTTFLACTSFTMLARVTFPIVWNHLTEWNCSFNLQEPQMFLLSDVFTLFKDLGNDWSAGEPLDISMFVPKNFTFDLSFSDFRLYCNANEQNIINIPNNLEENAHYVFTGPHLHANLVLPFHSFQSPKQEITFDVSIHQLSLRLILPVYNTIRQHLEDIDVEASNEYFYNGTGAPHTNSGASQFIFCEDFSLNGKYLYYQKVDPSYLNSVVLNIVGKNPTVKLFGFYVRYFLFLKNNFFGYTSHIINLDKYKDNIKKEKQKEEQGDTAHDDNGGDPEKREDQEDESNGLEIYVSLQLLDAMVYLPIGLYSSKQQATVGLNEFLLEIRYLPTYLDLYADFSPLVINIPITDSEEAKNVDHSIDILNRYIQINDFTFKLHFLYGPKPLVANYADFVNVHIGTVTGNVLISQLTCLGIWLENFSFHTGNKDNALSTKLVSKINPVYSLMNLQVNTISLYIYSSEHITEIRLSQGVKMHSNTLIDPLSHSKTVLEIPEISFKHLVPYSKSNDYRQHRLQPHHHHHHHAQNNQKRNKKWAEVGELKIAVNISIYNKEPNWEIDAEKQRVFLETHDSESKLLSFLWEDEDDFEELVKQSQLEQQWFENQNPNKGTKTKKKATGTVLNNTLFSPIHNPVGSKLSTEISPSMISSSTLTPLSAGKKTNSFLYPIGTSSHNNMLKWTTTNPNSSPLGMTGGVSSYDIFSAAVVNSSSNNQLRNSKSNLDISQYEDTDLSSDNDQYQTPESSLHDGPTISDDDHELSPDDDDQDALYATTKSAFLKESNMSTATNMGSMNQYQNQNPLGSSMNDPLRASASTNNLKNILKNRNVEESQQQPFDDNPVKRRNHLASFNPHIVALRNYLRLYFFNSTRARMAAFGSTSKHSSFVECTHQRQTKSSYNSNNLFGNPHESIHNLATDSIHSSYMDYLSSELPIDQIPFIPKRTKSKKLIISPHYQPMGHAHDDKDQHQCTYGQDTCSTTIFIDSMRDIELFATPVIVNILEELVESFIAKDPSIDYMLDYFQLKTISQQFKVKKFLHNQVKLNIFIHKFNLNWIQSLSISPLSPNFEGKNDNSINNNNNNKEKSRNENVELYTTEIQLESIQFFLSTCSKQSSKPQQQQIDNTQQLLPKEEFCLFHTKFNVKSLHGCMRYHNEQNVGTAGKTTAKSKENIYSIPSEILSKYHSKSFTNQIVVASLSAEGIKLKGKIMDDQQAGQVANNIPSGAFKVWIGQIAVNSTPNSPAILFRVVNTWIAHISALVSVFGRYQELWSRRMQTLIAELFRAKSRSLGAFDKNNDLNYLRDKLDFISPEFKEIIGDEAIIHRLGWEDISKLRHFLTRFAERPLIDQVVGNVTLDEAQDSYLIFQELINEIYETDEGGDLIHLFQSPLIKKAFIPEPGDNTKLDIDLQFAFEGISLVVNNSNNCNHSSGNSSSNPKTSSTTSTTTNTTSNSNAANNNNNSNSNNFVNQLAIGRVSGGAIAQYEYESHSDVLSKSSSPKSSVNINFFSSCKQVLLKISPDLISFIQNTLLVIQSSDVEVLKGEELILGSHEWKEAIKPSTSRDFHSKNPVSPASSSVRSNTVLSSIDESSNEGSSSTPLTTNPPLSPSRSKHVKRETSPNLNLIASAAQQQMKAQNPPVPTLNLNTESEEQQKKKNKRNIQSQKNGTKTIITVHGHFSFEEIHCRALSSNNGTLRMVLHNLSFIFNEFGSGSKKTQSDGSRPNGDYIDMIHSCIFSIPDIELHLLDHNSTDTNKPIFGITVKNLALNEVLFKIGKKKTRQTQSGKREDYIDFSLKYDLFLTFSQAILPFKMSHQFLPKLRGFLTEWTPPSKNSSPTTSPTQMKKNSIAGGANTNNMSLKDVKFPPLRIKLDLYDILISTDAISSLPVKYNISRITTSISQFSPNEMEFNIQLHQHQITFVSIKSNPSTATNGNSNTKPTTNSNTNSSPKENIELTKEPFTFPKIRAFGSIKNKPSKDKIDLLCNLEIGYLQNTLSIDLLQNILVLRTTLSKEIDDLLGVYINFAEKKQQQQQQQQQKLTLQPINQTESIFSKVNYNCSLTLRGFDFLFINNSASLLLSCGTISVKVLYSQRNNLSTTKLLSHNNTLNWKVGLQDISLILSDPTLTLVKNQPHMNAHTRVQKMKSQIWGGILTDIALQSFPFGGANKQKPAPLISKSSNIFEKAWVSINKTVVTLQPWAIDKATDLWIYYFNAYQNTQSKLSKISMAKRKQAVQKAFNSIPSSLPIKETNLTLHITIVDTNIVIPLTLVDGQPQPKIVRSKSQQHNDLTCSALVISLKTFSLYGVALKNKKLLLTSPKNISKSTTAIDQHPMKVIGDCKFSKFSFQFVDGYHPSKIHAIHMLPSVNRGVIESGDCQMTGLFSTHLVQLFVQLNTTGIFLHLDTNLMSYIIQFQDLIYLGQEKIKKINQEEQEKKLQEQQTQSSSRLKTPSPQRISATPSTSTNAEYKLEIEFTLNTSAGEARLTKQGSYDDTSSTIDNNPSLYSSFDHNTSPPLSSHHKDPLEEPFQQCFLLPPISVSATHVLIPRPNGNGSNSSNNLLAATVVDLPPISSGGTAPSSSKSETNILMVLESQEIRLTPFFANFLQELIANTPESTIAAQYSQQAATASPTNNEEEMATPGSTTFSIRINPLKLLLNSFDSTLAILEVGTMDIFLSSIKKKSSSTNRQVLLMNGTINLNTILLKMVHLGSSEERMGFIIRSIKGNVGTAHGITSQGPLVSVLLNCDNSHGYFNIKYLDEVILFVNQWIPTPNTNEKKIVISPLLDRKNIPVPSTPTDERKSTPSTPSSSTTATKKKPQFYVSLKIGSFGLDLDFLPVSRFNLLIENICGIYSPLSEEQDNKMMSLEQNQYDLINSLFFVTCYTGPISISCHGKLDGNLDLEGVILCGERKLYKVSNTVNMWTFQVSPTRVSFDFNQSEILELRSGDIVAKFSDLPIENSASNQRNINAELNCSMLQLQLSCETITSVLEITKRINEAIQEKIQSAKQNIILHGRNSSIFKRSTPTTSPLNSPVLTARSASMESISGGPVDKLILGQIKVKGSYFTILLFGYSIQDPTWISFNLDSYQLILDQSRKRNDEIHRQLSILLGNNHISKMVEDYQNNPNNTNWNRNDPFSRASIETKIIKIPVSSLIMYSTERTNSKIEYYYLTEFTDSIVISVNLNLYADLREIVQTYIDVLATSPAPVTNSPKSLTTSQTIKQKSNSNTIDDTSSVSSISKDKDAKMRKDLKSNRIFIEKKFQLSPTLNVLGEFTPKITTVFGWLGIKDINYTIPFYTHIGLTDNLENVLNQFLNFSIILNQNQIIQNIIII
ncbi:hypothetical protein CYY_008551, partial [Polysphondylium violaceum]